MDLASIYVMLRRVKKVGNNVFVGVSGGVDSSVSLALLKEQGYNVTGVFIKVWYPDWLGEGCDWRSERRDAMRVCATVGVPFLTLDLEDVYKKEVVDYLIETYKNGETPNPDVMCNRYVKFGSFWDFAQKHGADYIATGHYAQRKIENGKWKMENSVDTDKDQTYFLWTLTPEDLEHVLFPIGHLTKPEVRKLAEKFELPTSAKKDSQGLCFLGDVTIRDLLSHYVETKKGSVLTENGEIIGEHDGAFFYTIGQRHGFTLQNKETYSIPHYIIAKDIDKNTITVSTKNRIEQPIKNISLTHVNWLSDTHKTNCLVKIRHRGKLLECSVLIDGKRGTVSFIDDISREFPAIGQSVVFYKDGMCLGGGIIESIQ
ncbi:MAG: tRNA 2-thiouridine(34) synthase MnmA [Candidatus Zambryskibacteria bacterium CG10_big_fil_rev_8_21_14_0_10_42_12]|uniref:tRNA-specific 2-thiouridylase MnmA n=1 Tax=Candidatus Zambryskibacteria bacterium CG10_big_fil_rev_8_21_14_0_10_42_12 TaxID=1975115 RepID=A0A2H0QX14_9BACT|nr:MAG: tRNA 2-thiouridine(34) synthase MnmA [Candidatus Zambryskibacteria bacterium CG10_big_fil_rev_8_21_14_0_10_42_12]